MPRAVLFAVAVLASTPAFAALDMVFLLDTTGSMGGELGEAKERVRQLAEALKAQRQGERVRLGVVAYRDRGDAYVTKKSDLTDDVDVSFRFLASLAAEGGGDGPEDVLSGLSAAIHEMKWDPGDDVERQIFLIGDAPPHLDYQGHVKPEELITAARQRHIVVHGVGCRSLPAEGVSFFEKVAYATEGTYQHIGQVRNANTGGLEKAMMKALARPSNRVGQLEGRAMQVEVAAQRPESDGLAITPIASDKGVCTVRVSLPKGLALRGVPGGTLGDKELELQAQVAPGEGGTWVLSLGTCTDASTRVRLALRK